MFPPRGRLIGIDYGDVRVGIAVCDADRKIASPLGVYRRVNQQKDCKYFQRLVADEMAVGFVVGLAYSLNGTEGPAAKKCRTFAEWLKTTTGLPHVFQDERFTTYHAEEVLQEVGLSISQRQSTRDMIAATAILQAWIDTPVELTENGA